MSLSAITLYSICSELHTDSRLLTCDQSLDRLIALLQVNSFSSGSHIDYYDDDDDDD